VSRQRSGEYGLWARANIVYHVYMAKGRFRTKSTSARGKPKRDTPALRSLRAALSDFADIRVVTPAVRPKPAVIRAIRKAVRDYYQDPKTLERT